MIYLILAISCSFTVSVLVKIYELRCAKTEIVLASNYVVASIIGWLIAYSYGFDKISPSTVIMGVVGGILWPLTFFLLMFGIRRFGLSLTGTIARLALVVPVIVALIFFGEKLTRNIGVGLLIALVAFFLLNPPSRQDARRLNLTNILFFPLLAIFFGSTYTWVNVFNKLGVAKEQFLFIVLVFTFAGLFSWIYVLTSRQRLDKNSIARGLFLGIPNYFSTFFLMLSLKSQYFADKSAVTYALYAVMGVILAFLGGVIIWREKVNRWNVLGVAFAIVAIILLDLG